MDFFTDDLEELVEEIDEPCINCIRWVFTSHPNRIVEYGDLVFGVAVLHSQEPDDYLYEELNRALAELKQENYIASTTFGPTLVYHDPAIPTEWVESFIRAEVHS